MSELYFSPLPTPKVTKDRGADLGSQLQDATHGEYNIDGSYNKDINTTGGKSQDGKEDRSPFWKWMDELFSTENIFLHKHDPLEHFPGVHPSLGPNLGSLRSMRRVAAEDKIRVELLKALTRAYEKGIINVPPTYAKIEVGGREYTYEDLPEHLLDEAFSKIIKDTEGAAPAAEDEETSSADEFANMMSNPPGIGQVSAAKVFPTRWDIEGETTLSMPEQTDNKRPVQEGPRWKKEVEPHEESKPYIQDGNGASDPEKFYEDQLADVYFFGR